MNRNEWISQQYKYLHSIHNTHTHAYMDCFCLSSARFVYFTAQKLVLFSNFSCQLLLWFFYMCLFAPHCCHGKSQSRTIFFPIFFVMCLDLFQAAADWNFITGKLKNDWRQKKSRNQECNFNMMLKFCYWFNEFHFFFSVKSGAFHILDFNMKFFTFHRILVLVNIGTEMLVRFLFFYYTHCFLRLFFRKIRSIVL